MQINVTPFSARHYYKGTIHAIAEKRSDLRESKGDSKVSVDAYGLETAVSFKTFMLS